jgi:hypothetical protein
VKGTLGRERDVVTDCMSVVSNLVRSLRSEVKLPEFDIYVCP